MSRDRRDTPVEELRNSQLLRAEYGIPSSQAEVWRNESDVVEQRALEVSSRREVERAIDRLELVRTEALLARARFFARVRAATRNGTALLGATVNRGVPLLARVALVTLVGVALVALLVLRRNEREGSGLLQQ